MRYSNNYGHHDGSPEEIEREQAELQGTCTGPDDPLCDGPECTCHEGEEE